MNGGESDSNTPTAEGAATAKSERRAVLPAAAPPPHTLTTDQPTDRPTDRTNRTREQSHTTNKQTDREAVHTRTTHANRETNQSTERASGPANELTLTHWHTRPQRTCHRPRRPSPGSGANSARVRSGPVRTPNEGSDEQSDGLSLCPRMGRARAGDGPRRERPLRMSRIALDRQSAGAGHALRPEWRLSRRHHTSRRPSSERPTARARGSFAVRGFCGLLP